jgi:hypothetical protein
MQNTMQENEKKNALEQKEELNETNLEKVTGGRIRHMSPEKDLSDEKSLHCERSRAPLPRQWKHWILEISR